jgi:cytoskeletal protein RodZ
MTNFFTKYKKLREDQKIDLADIENRTKINIKYLEALEKGNFDLIQEPYVRLFLRAYINEIGAEPDEAVSELTEYLLKKDGSKPKETEETEQEINTSDEKKEDVSIPSDKKFDKFQDISSDVGKKKVHKGTTIPPNLIKGILFLVLWVVIIIVIRNITLNNKNDGTNAPTDQIIESITNFTSFEQLQADFLEASSQQTAIEQSLPLIVKIVTNKALGIVSAQDSLEIISIPIAAGDQKTFSFDSNLDILLHHSEGVAIFVNGDKIQDIRSQQTPVQLIFSIEPKSITIKHYSKTG